MTKISDFLDNFPGEMTVSLYSNQTPLGPHGARDDEDEPENTRMVNGEEYMTVAEYLRRVDPLFYPQVEELISSSGVDRTYQVLGKMAAERGRLVRVTPVKMFHPDFENGVNGWPEHVIRDAWTRFKIRYYPISWLERDEVKPDIPKPVKMPAPEYNPKLWEQVREAAARRGVHYPYTRDPRWRGAFRVLLDERPDETPEQAMVRRTSAAGAMFAIEKEYQGR